MPAALASLMTSCDPQQQTMVSVTGNRIQRTGTQWPEPPAFKMTHVTAATSAVSPDQTRRRACGSARCPFARPGPGGVCSRVHGGRFGGAAPPSPSPHSSPPYMHFNNEQHPTALSESERRKTALCRPKRWLTYQMSASSLRTRLAGSAPFSSWSVPSVAVCAHPSSDAGHGRLQANGLLLLSAALPLQSMAHIDLALLRARLPPGVSSYTLLALLLTITILGEAYLGHELAAAAAAPAIDLQHDGLHAEVLHT